jgi:large subunit ribosomal protein L30
MPAKLRVTLIKSPISHTQRTRATMSALGLHRIGQSVVVADTPELRGMTRAIGFLLRTEPLDESAATQASTKSAPRKKEASKS